MRLATASLLFILFVGSSVYAQVGFRPLEPTPMTIDRVAVREYVDNFNPVVNDKMWFIVLLPSGQLNVFVHPDNVTVETSVACGLLMSASGMATRDPGWPVLSADRVTLYAPDEESRARWQEYVEYLRAGLRRGLRDLPVAYISPRNSEAVIVVRDAFWNFGEPMRIFAPFGGVTVVIDERLGLDECRVSAPEAQVTFRGNSLDPVPHLQANSVTVSVRDQATAERLRQCLNQWQEEWNNRDCPRRVLPPPR